MSKSISSVMLVFENCETAIIPVQSILWLHRGESTNVIHRYSNSINSYDMIQEFGIAIEKSCEVDLFSNVTLAERLASYDVTQVVFNYTNNIEADMFLIDWDTNSAQYSSTNQRLTFSPLGHLIFISTTAGIVKYDEDAIDTMAKYVSKK